MMGIYGSGYLSSPNRFSSELETNAIVLSLCQLVFHSAQCCSNVVCRRVIVQSLGVATFLSIIIVAEQLSV